MVVINETNPDPFNLQDTGRLTDYASAKEGGEDIKAWVAAELDPNWFEYHSEFVVGDGRYYGTYLNHGPLPNNQDFHVTIGLVSTLNNVTKGN